MNKDKLTFNTDRTIFTGGTISSVTAGLTVLEKTALFKTSPLRREKDKAYDSQNCEKSLKKMLKKRFEPDFKACVITMVVIVIK